MIFRSLKLGLYQQAKKLQKLDFQLIELLKHKKTFNFIDAISEGISLLVGEDNLSFSQSLIKEKSINPRKLTSTTLEKVSELLPSVYERAKMLKHEGVNILHDVDATQLSYTFGNKQFDTIIFQFPHSGSRESINGRNSNFILLCQFLNSAKKQLTSRGKILVTLVDNPHYRGAFQCEEAAEKTGFLSPECYAFDPTYFKGYEHSMTNEEEGVLDEHKSFCTWVFRPF